MLSCWEWSQCFCVQVWPGYKKRAWANCYFWQRTRFTQRHFLSDMVVRGSSSLMIFLGQDKKGPRHHDNYCPKKTIFVIRYIIWYLSFYLSIGNLSSRSQICAQWVIIRVGALCEVQSWAMQWRPPPPIHPFPPNPPHPPPHPPLPPLIHTHHPPSAHRPGSSKLERPTWQLGCLWPASYSPQGALPQRFRGRPYITVF